MRERGSRPFKAGLVLEEAVSRGLDELWIRHRRTQQWGKEDVRDCLDLIITPGGGRPDIEIQLTLRPKHRDKIFRFAYRALTTGRRGIRLYIEVVAAHRRSADLGVVGRHVAEAIKLVVRRFRDFGSERILGLRIHAATSKIEKFDLVEFCGSRLMRLVEEWREARRIEREAARESATSRRQPFWHAIRRALSRPTRERVSPHWHEPFHDSRAHFVPRRFCAHN